MARPHSSSGFLERLRLGPTDRARSTSIEKWAIAASVQLLLFIAVWTVLGLDAMTAVIRVAQLDVAFLVVLAIAVAVIAARDEPVTGLAAIRGTTSLTIEAIQSAVRADIKLEPAAFPASDGVMFLAWRTPRTRATFGDWIVVSLTADANGGLAVVALSWHRLRSIGFFAGRRNLERLAELVAFDESKLLSRRSGFRILKEWIDSGVLTSEGTARPVWIED